MSMNINCKFTDNYDGSEGDKYSLLSDRAKNLKMKIKNKIPCKMR